MSRSKPRDRRPETPPWLARAAAPAVIALLTLVAYAPALDNTFVYWDDPWYVLRSDLVLSPDVGLAEVFTRTTLNNYHPLTILSWRWNVEECGECIFGYEARPFILWNLVLHVVNSLLVFFLTWRLGGRNITVGLFSSAVFALHPMHVEAVAWISQRKDVLHVFFLLCALLTWDRFLDGRYAQVRRSEHGWLAATLGLFLLACLSKATAVVFPLLMLLLDFWRNPAASPRLALREMLAPRKLVAVAPFFALSLGFGLVALDLQGGGNFHGLLVEANPGQGESSFRAFTPMQRVHFASYGFCAYLVKLFVPTGLAPWHAYPVEQDYQRSWTYGLALVAVLGILAGAAASLRSGKLLAFGVGFYAIVVAPVLQLVSVGTALTAERYTYLAYIGPAFVIAVALSGWVEKRPRRRRAPVHALAAVLAMAWLVQSRQQVEVWQDSDVLWTRVIELYPHELWPYWHRANYYDSMAQYWSLSGDLDRWRHYAGKAETDRAILEEKRALYE